MGEKDKNSNQGDQKNGNNNNKNNGGGKNNVTVVLKTDIHCEGCETKIVKCIRSFGGVDTVSIGDGQKITVVGILDPAKLRDKLEQKTHKKVELLSPQAKKDGGDNKDNGNGKQNGNANQEKKNESKDQKSNGKPEEKKKANEKEPPVTTAVLKVHLHCEGCIQKIYRTITKTKGYQDMKIDKEKDLVTVTGAMDMKALADVLLKQLKKTVEIVPQKKENEKKENSGGGDKGNNGGGDKGNNGDGGDGNKMMMMQQQSQMVGNPYPQMYGSGAFGDQFQFHQYHAPQMFSDENPNACAVM